AVLVGAVGLAVVGFGRSAATPAVAMLLTLAAALSWAIGNVLSRRVRSASGLSLTVWSGLVVPVPAVLLSLLVDGPAEVGHALTHLPVSALLATAYTAYLASLVGYGLWNHLLGRHPAAAVVPFALLVPVVGMLAAWAVQGETPNAAETVGGLLLLTGVAGAVVRPAARPRRESGGRPRDACRERVLDGG
ncbi:MAG TPA: EamA family transporter, partial [Actinomycetes bacterium]|nr:EamA family transporter [Actinomycetes bacterium]